MSEKIDQSKQDLLSSVQNQISGIKTSIRSLVELSEKMAGHSETASFERELSAMQAAASLIVTQLGSLRIVITPPVEKAPVESSASPACRALVVDDNSTNRRVLTHLLKRRGCQVAEAENGKIACDLVAQGNVDIVFMDLSMPVMDGLQASVFIRQHLSAPISKVPIFAVTAHALAETQAACVSAGMNGFIAKPISAADITKAIDTLSSTKDSPSAELAS